MDLVIFEQNKPLVLEGLEQGEFDYIDAAGEVFETEFFRYINAKKILESLAETYPTPRKKEEVPLWFYIASNLSMRLHGAHSFHAFPIVEEFVQGVGKAVINLLILDRGFLDGKAISRCTCSESIVGR